MENIKVEKLCVHDELSRLFYLCGGPMPELAVGFCFPEGSVGGCSVKEKHELTWGSAPPKFSTWCPRGSM